MVKITFYNNYTNKYLEIPPKEGDTGTTTINTDDFTNGVTLSQYQINYILIHYLEMINRIIKSQPKNVHNPKFQEFVQYVHEYARILDDARNDQNGNAKNPFFSANPNDITQFSDINNCAMTDQVKNSIHDSIVAHKSGKFKFNPNKYAALPQNKIEINYGFDAQFVRHDCDGLDNFTKEVIIPTENKWQEYLSSTKTKSGQYNNEFNEFDDLREKFIDVMNNVNTQTTSGDYKQNYAIVEKNLKNSITFIKNLMSSYSTEYNIIKNTANIDNFYENLKFDDGDIEQSLILPQANDVDDLVSKNEITNKLNESIEKYSKMSNASIVLNAYNIPSHIQMTNNVSTQVANLLGDLQNTNDINNPDENMELLTMTKIYVDDKGNKTAQKLTDSDEKKIQLLEKTRQTNFLNSIDKKTNITANGITAENRVTKYKIAYPYANQKYAATGGKSSIITKKYNLDEKIMPNSSLTQTGGRELDMELSAKQSKVSSDNIINIKNGLDKRINWNSENQNLFDDIINSQNLTKKNLFLVEMINIIKLNNFFILNNASGQNLLENKLKKNTTKIKQNLDKISAYMNVPLHEIDLDEVKQQLRNSSVQLTADIQNLLSKIGIEYIHNYDPMLNQNILLQTLNKLFDNNIGDTLIISQYLLQMPFMAAQLSDTKQDKKIADLHKKLYVFYDRLISVNKKIAVDKQHLKKGMFDISKINDFAGEIIEENIITGNAAVTYLITVIRKLWN